MHSAKSASNIVATRRRVPTARPPTPERFDAYVSVRSGADLGNKANLNSPEQRMLEQVRTFDL